MRSVGWENWLRDGGARVGIRTIEDLIYEREKDSWLDVARQNCRGGIFVHGADSMGGENRCGNLLW